MTKSNRTETRCQKQSNQNDRLDLRIPSGISLGRLLPICMPSLNTRRAIVTCATHFVLLAVYRWLRLCKGEHRLTMARVLNSGSATLLGLLTAIPLPSARRPQITTADALFPATLSHLVATRAPCDDEAAPRKKKEPIGMGSCGRQSRPQHNCHDSLQAMPAWFREVAPDSSWSGHTNHELFE